MPRALYGLGLGWTVSNSRGAVVTPRQDSCDALASWLWRSLIEGQDLFARRGP